MYFYYFWHSSIYKLLVQCKYYIWSDNTSMLGAMSNECFRVFLVEHSTILLVYFHNIVHKKTSGPCVHVPSLPPPVLGNSFLGWNDFIKGFMLYWTAYNPFGCLYQQTYCKQDKQIYIKSRCQFWYTKSNNPSKCLARFLREQWNNEGSVLVSAFRTLDYQQT